MSHFKKRIDLLKKPVFRRYILSCFSSTTGTGLVYIAMSWMILRSHDSVLGIVVLMVCFWLPRIIIGPLAGVVSDRWPRKWLLSIVALIRAVIMIVFGIYLNKHFSTNGIYLLAVLQGSCFAFIWPSMTRFVRELVDEEDLLYANATIDIAYEIGNMIGMGAAGFLIAFFSGPYTFIINGIFFVLTAILTMTIPSSALQVVPHDRKATFYSDFKVGVRYIFDRKFLMVIYTIQLLILVEVMLTPVLLAPFAKNILHTNAKQFGDIEASASVGIIVGGLFMPWLSEKFGLLKTLALSIIVLGLSFVLFSINRRVHAADILYFTVGVGLAVWPLIMTKAQDLTCVEFQGRVQSTFGSLMSVVVLLTYVFISVGSKFIPVYDLYWVEVAFSVVAVALLFIYRKAF